MRRCSADAKRRAGREMSLSSIGGMAGLQVQRDQLPERQLALHAGAQRQRHRRPLAGEAAHRHAVVHLERDVAEHVPDLAREAGDQPEVAGRPARRDERLPGQVLGRDERLAGQVVAGRRNDDEIHRPQQIGPQAADGAHGRDQGEADLAGLDQLDDLGQGAGQDAHHHVGGAPAVLDQQGGNRVMHQPARDAHRDVPATSLGEVAEHADHVLGAEHGLVRVRVHQPPRVGELHRPAGVADEQRLAKQFLQPLDVGAHRGLREAENGSGGAHAAPLHDEGEDLQAVQGGVVHQAAFRAPPLTEPSGDGHPLLPAAARTAVQARRNLKREVKRGTSDDRQISIFTGRVRTRRGDHDNQP